MKYLLKLSYLGTAYHGFQVQPNVRTVQKELCDAARSVFGMPLNVSGCSRTDSGVHALEFYCTAELVESGPNIPPDALFRAMNSALPHDIAVCAAQEVPDSFHVRYDVRCKEYEYRIWNAPVRDPFLKDRAFHFSGKLDAHKMHSAAQDFLGKHNFTSFMAQGSKITDPVRTVYTAGVRCEGNMICFCVSADGFLYNMVRIMIGTLIDIGAGRINEKSIPCILTSENRDAAGATAPAHGLYLKTVSYCPEAGVRI